MGLFAPPVRVSPSFDRAVLVNTGRVHCPNTPTSPAKLPGRVLSKATWLPHGEDAAPKHSSGSPFRERHCCGDDVRERDSGDIAKPPRRWSLPSDVDGGEGYIRNTGATRRLSETSMRSFPILPHPRMSQSPPTIASADAPSQSLPGFRSPIPEPFPESPGKVCRRAHAARHRSLWSLRRRGGTRMNRLGQKRDSCRPGASAVRPILRGSTGRQRGAGDKWRLRRGCCPPDHSFIESLPHLRCDSVPCWHAGAGGALGMLRLAKSTSKVSHSRTMPSRTTPGNSTRVAGDMCIAIAIGNSAHPGRRIAVRLELCGPVEPPSLHCCVLVIISLTGHLAPLFQRWPRAISSDWHGAYAGALMRRHLVGVLARGPGIGVGLENL